MGRITVVKVWVSVTPFSASALLVWHEEEHPTCKNRVMRCWHVICLEQGAKHDLRVFQMMSLPPRHLLVH